MSLKRLTLAHLQKINKGPVSPELTWTFEFSTKELFFSGANTSLVPGTPTFGTNTTEKLENPWGWRCKVGRRGVLVGFCRPLGPKPEDFIQRCKYIRTNILICPRHPAFLTSSYTCCRGPVRHCAGHSEPSHHKTI